MRTSTFVLASVLTVASTFHALAEPVARVGGRVVDQEEIDQAFGPDDRAKDDLRSLAVVSLLVAQGVEGVGGGDASSLRVRDAVAFLQDLDKDATKHVGETLQEKDYEEAYDARPKVAGDPAADVPWVGVSQEDKAAFEAAYAARMGFRMACATIRGALAGARVEWLVAEPASWRTVFSSPSNCGTDPVPGLR